MFQPKLFSCHNGILDEVRLFVPLYEKKESLLGTETVVQCGREGTGYRGTGWICSTPVQNYTGWIGFICHQ